MTESEPELSFDELLAESRELIEDFDSVPWPQMTAMFYQHAYEELRLHLGMILDALESDRPAS
ncbi:hypothetical protein E4U02_07500 [Microbacterium paludicola]|jgi:hypothetical protein|uniref:Uncharacterized protein n=1 Tax=Microbacterium paludicola TaxID=300019 RepID=A0A4Y9FWU7_9MICO|nr:hypothetical protein [Microbacterium paludicola]MBF0816250.1 hypothetical protein [Microbacterium paludicola]TFU33053.1 hypothetical protein E4U02_07500 [Microbacterium paludicola]